MKQYVYKKRRWIWLAKGVDSLGRILKPFISCPSPLPPAGKVKKILIVKLDHLGDLILTTPSLELLRKTFPQAQITLLAGPWGKDLLNGCPYIDQLVVCRPNWLEQGSKKKIYWKDILELICLLRKQKNELVFELRGDLISIMIAYASKIPYRVGFGIAGGGWLLTHEVPFNNRKHQVQIIMDIIVHAFPPPSPPNFAPQVFLQSAERNWACQWLKEAGISKNQLLVGIHIGAGYPSKLWGADKYLQLIKLLTQEANAKICLIGGKGEEKYLTGIEEYLPQGVFCLIGETDIMQTAALLERCQLFVGNDSAPAHLAAAVGTSAVVVFSAANSSLRWAPYGDNVHVISKEDEVPCAGCERPSCESKQCMNLISVKEVFAKIKQQLSKNQKGHEKNITH